jgi:hypothetical protein
MCVRRLLRESARRAGLVILLGVAAGACGDEQSSGERSPFAPPEQGPERTSPAGVALCEGVDCGHLINGQMEAFYEEAQVGYIREDDLRLCRRMSLDLIDRIPTWEEATGHCLGRSPEEMADYFMSLPDYVERGQRWWADVLAYNDAYDFSYWRFIEELDRIVGQLYRGEITYARFAELVLAHPAYVTRYSGQDRVNKAFDIFMGRDALPVESEDFEAFWRMWDVIDYEDTDYGTGYRRPVIDTRQCAGGTGEFLCESTLLGRHSVIIPVLDEIEPWNRETNRVDLDALTDEQWELLRTPGRVFSSQTMFWEAAVDRALLRFLSWYDGVGPFAKPPGTALPAVRDALVAWFIEDQSFPALERLIVTSALYTASSRAPDSEDRPVWSLGPIKQMSAEQWLYSIEDFTGYDLGNCDWRYPFVRGGNRGEDETYYHPHRYPVADPVNNRPDFSFAEVARVFGGCPDRDVFLRQTTTGVVLSLEAATVVVEACFSDAEGMYLTDDEGTRESVDIDSRLRLFRHQFREALTQEPTPEDLEALLSFSDACLENLEDCPAEELANRMCGSILRSNAFLFY